MKLLILLILFCLMSCSDKKPDKFEESDVFKISDISCSKPNIQKEIFRSDTTEKEGGHEIKYFDNKGKLLKVKIINLFENDSRKFKTHTTIYDSFGHTIYEETTESNVKFHCNCYKYDSFGHLIYKEEHSSSDIQDSNSSK